MNSHVFTLSLHNSIWLKHIVYFYYAYTQSFVIIKKKKIVGPKINFNNIKILNIDDTNHMF